LLCGHAEFLCSCYHVYILLLGGIWTTYAEIPLVEKIPHSNAAYSVLCLLSAYKYKSGDGV
ncbi:hypothetical protein ACJMK2_041901, partial [Sinanodonta woodiana]